MKIYSGYQYKEQTMKNANNMVKVNNDIMVNVHNKIKYEISNVIRKELHNGPWSRITAQKYILSPIYRQVNGNLFGLSKQRTNYEKR